MRVVLRTVLILAAFSPAAFNCSTVVIAGKGRVVAGANSDQPYDENTRVWFVPDTGDVLAHVCVGSEAVPAWSPPGGTCMNEHGLVMMRTATPPVPVPFDPDKPQLRHNFFEKVISDCVNVKQAVALLKSYSFPPGLPGGTHLMLADPSGESVIVEWVEDGIRIIPRTGPYQLMTNFLLSKPEAGQYPSSRFTRGEAMLKKAPEPVIGNVIPVLQEISQYGKIRGKEVGTLYTAVWDLNKLELRLFYKRDFTHPLVFNLNAETAKGAHMIEVRTLLPHPEPFESNYRGENGPVPRKPNDPATP